MAYDKFIIKNGAVIESILTGSTVLDVQGKNGQLFSVTDNLVGDIFAVSDITGIPILKVNSNGKITIDGSTDISESVNIGTDLNVTGALYVNGFRTSGTNTGDQPLGNLATYNYVDTTFLSKTGGTLTGILHMSNTTIDGNGGSLNLGGYNSNTIYLQTPGGLYYSPTGGTNYTIWHAKNAGTTSYDWNAKNLILAGSITGATTGTFSGLLTSYDSRVVGAGGTGDVQIELWRGANASWRLLNNSGTLYTQSNFIATVGSYYNVSSLAYNTGNAWFKGSVTSDTNIIADTAVFSNLTANYIPKHTAAGLVNTSVYDNGTNILVGTTTDSSSGKLQVIGDINASGKINFGSITNKCQMIYNSTENSIDFIIN